MFDTTLVASHPKRNVKGKLATLPVAVAIHLLALGSVVFGQLWIVDPVREVALVPPLLVAIVPPPGGGNRGGEKPKTERKAIGTALKRPPLVQPTDVARTIPDITQLDRTSTTPMTGTEGLFGREGQDVVSGGGEGPDLGGSSEEEGPTEPIVIGGQVVAPVPLERPAPAYPDIARRLRAQGVVILEATIDRAGNVVDVRVLKDPGFGLGEAALAAVREWRYQPATLNGRAVSVYLAVTVAFHLN